MITPEFDQFVTPLALVGGTSLVSYAIQVNLERIVSALERMTRPDSEPHRVVLRENLEEEK